MARKNDRYITGLDIGTHKVCAIIAEAMDDRRLNVVGAAHAAWVADAFVIVDHVFLGEHVKDLTIGRN